MKEKILSGILVALALTALSVNLTACSADTQAVECNAETSVNYESGILDVKFTPADTADGFVYVRCNSEALNDETHRYVVSLQNADEPDSKTGSGIYYQFTLNYFNDWIRCPLPYANTNMIVTEWNTDKYDEAFTADINYSPKKVETVSITGVGDYMQCVDNFNQKTALVYWTDEQEAQVTELLGLANIEAADVNEYEIEAFMTFVSGNATNDREHTKFEYDYDKKGRNRPEDKQYDVLIHRGVLENHKGVCSDLSAVYTVALRSKGIPCIYCEGWAEYDGNSGQHAWVQVADENNGFTGIADPTRGIDRVTDGNGTYTLYAMK